ncbi:hypothetical protein KEM55_006962 [Ascosphaera atra]|nr:hypothetical protein KEM55_006962 [Ascosphaera atra]
MPKPSIPLSAGLPPLVLGTATFNHQYNEDPYALPSTTIVRKALDSGITAFDTSPYYGPAEILLGQALATEYIREHYPRESYHILTKVGRISASCFDYSPTWIRKSVQRSLRRLHTEYLDVVYCHDVEFVSPQEVLDAVVELRRIRDEDGSIHYVGIAGYPVDTLCELAELVLQKTGEPLDIVQSYANYTLQNKRLASSALPRLTKAKVDVVTNASPLGMGLLRQAGVPIGGMGDFHPSPEGLRNAVLDASRWLSENNEKIEVVALRYALESWLYAGSAKGGAGSPGAIAKSQQQTESLERQRWGVSVIGVSSTGELDEILDVWRDVLRGAENGGDEATPERRRIQYLSEKVKDILGSTWYNYAWPSPDEGFVNSPNPDHDREDV